MKAKDVKEKVNKLNGLPFFAKVNQTTKGRRELPRIIRPVVRERARARERENIAWCVGACQAILSSRCGLRSFYCFAKVY